MATTRTRRTSARARSSSSAAGQDDAHAEDGDSNGHEASPKAARPARSRARARLGRRDEIESGDEHEQPQDDDAGDNDSEQESEQDESSEEEEYVEPALLSRSRRANAGSRMQQLIQDEQMGAQEAKQLSAAAEDDEIFKEEEGDVDFETKAEEKDEFDSDFGSTDSDDDQDDDDEDEQGPGKRKVRKTRAVDDDDEEGRSKKRKKVAHKPFIPSFANQTKYAARQRQREQQQQALASSHAIGDGSSVGDEVAPPSNRPYRPRPGIDPASAFAAPQRESARKSAVQFKEVVQQRLEESEKRRAAVAKQIKKQSKSLTQADLIAEALETEEVNRASLLAFYAAEEDRRAADKIAGMRYEIIGPKLTFLSRVESDQPEGQQADEDEDGTVRAQAGADGKRRSDRAGGKSPLKMQSGRRRLIQVIGEAGRENFDRSSQVKAAREAAKAAAEADGVAVPDKIVELDRASGSERGEADSAAEQVTGENEEAQGNELESTGSKRPARKTENDAHTRNYLIFGAFDDVSRADELGALFGNHCDWSKRILEPLAEGTNGPVPLGEVKLIFSFRMTLDKRHPVCPITGLKARYIEPRTGTPYATAEAYRTIVAIASSLEQTTDVPRNQAEQLCPFVFTSTRPRRYKPAPLNEFGDPAVPGELVASQSMLEPAVSAQEPTYYVPQVDVYEDDGVGAFVGMTGIGLWSTIETQRRKVGVGLYGGYDQIGGEDERNFFVRGEMGESSAGTSSRKGRRRSENVIEQNPYERDYGTGPLRSSRRRSRGGVQDEVDSSSLPARAVPTESVVDSAQDNVHDDAKRARPPRRSAARKKASYDDDGNDDDQMM
ncbi:hypothetical protein OIV83_004554 [Microbotryomycetes sp. JL201]|nr:hypothetical protein OIV83_004554 [Microbotryomycetes sp. JL201]